MGSGLTGKLGPAWVGSWVGAWVGAWVVHWCWGTHIICLLVSLHLSLTVRKRAKTGKSIVETTDTAAVFLVFLEILLFAIHSLYFLNC